MERSLNWFDQTNNIHVAKSTRPSNRRDKHLVYCMHVNRHATKIIDYQIIYTPAKGKFLSKGTTAVILRKYHLHFYKKMLFGVISLSTCFMTRNTMAETNLLLFS